MDDLHSFVRHTALKAANAHIVRLAGLLREKHRGVLCVLAYGSALRDSSPSETLIDYYLLVENRTQLGGNVFLKTLGDIIPPNVFYFESPDGTEKIRCKYAVMTLARFEELVSPDTSNPYLWARFAQPCRIVWSANAEVQDITIAALTQALRTSYAHARFLAPEAGPEQAWRHFFANTYRTELRPESGGRAAMIVSADLAYYTDAAQRMADTAPLPSNWTAKRFFGAFWSVARLAKAAFTFEGGADYAAWKIERHSGVKIAVSDWQRRHPFLSGLMLLPRLLRSKGLR